MQNWKYFEKLPCLLGTFSTYLNLSNTNDIGNIAMRKCWKYKREKLVGEILKTGSWINKETEKLWQTELRDCETWCLKKIGLLGPVHVSSYQRLEAESQNQSYKISKLK